MIHVFVVDPQGDFSCDQQNPLPNGQPGSLCVPGAWDDAMRLARFFDESGKAIGRVTVSLDQHVYHHIGNNVFWRNCSTGETLPPFAGVSAQQIRDHVWEPVIPGMRDYALKYAETLESNGRYSIVGWPVHCLIGSYGAAIVPPLFEALMRWSQRTGGTIFFVSKGSNMRTEHYSPVRADVPDPRDPSSQLNTALIGRFESSTVNIIGGQARNVCVKHLMDDVHQELGDGAVKSWTLLSNGSSPILTSPELKKADTDLIAKFTGLGMGFKSCDEVLGEIS